MNKVITIGSIGFVVMLLIIVGVGTYQGERLEYSTIDMFSESTLEESNIICDSYHGSVISTEEILEGFIEDCNITTVLNYNENDFDKTSLIVYIHEGSGDNTIKKFYDGFFGLDGSEVINYSKRKPISKCKCSSWEIYLIEIPKDNVKSADIIFDRIY